MVVKAVKTATIKTLFAPPDFCRRPFGAGGILTGNRNAGFHTWLPYNILQVFPKILPKAMKNELDQVFAKRLT